MFSEERSVYSSIRGLGAGNDEGGRTDSGAEAHKSLVVLPGSTVLFCSGNNVVFSPKRGNLYGKEGVHVELNRHRGVFPCIFPPKRGTVKIMLRLF